MILLAEKEKEQQLLLHLCEKTAFGCKIAALARSYRFDKRFACFWLDTGAQAAYCLVDGIMLLSGTLVQGQETREFLRAVGAQAVFCAVRNAEALGLTPLQTGDLLRRQSPRGEEVLLPQPQDQVNIRQLYGLLEETGMTGEAGEIGEFEAFYLDLSHKLRHGTARVATAFQEKELAGCAIVSAVSREGAVLSALAVGEKYRRQGLGTRLARQIEANLPGKNLYVFREKDKHKAFYRQLEYAKIDTWVLGRL